MRQLLVVEDSPTQARLFAAVCRQAGCNVEIARTAEQAEQKMLAADFDLLLIDIRLPGEDGIGFCRRVKSRREGTRPSVVLMTHFADPLNVLRGLEAGADGFLVKSDSPEAMIPRLQTLLQRDRSSDGRASTAARAVTFRGQEFTVAADSDRLLDVLLDALTGIHELCERYKQEALDRKRAERALQAAHDQLERMVDERTSELRETNRRLRLEIEERRRAESSLTEKDEQLRQSQKLEAVGTLAGGVAHEFNNVLQIIKGYIGFAAEGLEPGDSRYEDLQVALQASNRATLLTHQLLGFGRRKVLKPIDFDPRDAAGDLLKMLRPTIGERIHLETSLPDQVSHIHADPGAVQQVLLNLCLNARDAMPQGGTLAITLEDWPAERVDSGKCAAGSAGHYVRFAVTDTGEGIPEEMRSRIFEPFFTTKEVGRGTGLGLSMAYGAVHQQGGWIEVESAVGRGSSFYVFLPAVAASSPEDPVPETAPPVASGGEMILIAEDDSTVRYLMLRILQSAGYRTLAASDGEEAVQLFSRHADTIRLMILDVVMPKMDAYQVHEHLCRTAAEVPIILCSGHDPEAMLQDLTPKGIRYLDKPFSPGALLQSVRDALDGKPITEQMIRPAAPLST